MWPPIVAVLVSSIWLDHVTPAILPNPLGRPRALVFAIAALERATDNLTVYSDAFDFDNPRPTRRPDG